MKFGAKYFPNFPTFLCHFLEALTLSPNNVDNSEFSEYSQCFLKKLYIGIDREQSETGSDIQCLSEILDMIGIDREKSESGSDIQ